MLSLISHLVKYPSVNRAGTMSNPDTMVRRSRFIVCLLSLVATCVLSLNIDTSRSSPKEFKTFLDKHWDVITTLDPTVNGLTIRKSADQQNEIAFDTEDAFKYGYLSVSEIGSMDFKVKAAHDVYISFAPDPFDLDPILEMFIGGSDNSKSGIRYNRTLPNLLEVVTPGILNADEFTDFHVEWGSGACSIWRAGEPRPFISWKQPKSFHVSYIGLRTSFGAKGSWAIQNVSTAEVVEVVDVSTEYPRGVSLRFRVRARNDAHVGLSTNSNLNGPIMEIVIGGWNNKRSVIRRGNSVLPDKVGVDIPDFLNGSEFRGFWVKWGKEVAVGREGEHCPFMTWTDPDPFTPKYFGLHTGFGSTGDWRVGGIPEVYTPDNTQYQFFPVERFKTGSNGFDNQNALQRVDRQ